MPGSGAEVVAEHLTKRYGPRMCALDDVCFRLCPGDFALLTGPSGSGKSTLLNMVAGLDRPDSGRVTVDGVGVGEVRDAARFRREVVGMVFQLHHLVPSLTARENVELPLIPTRMPARESRELAQRALAEVGLSRQRDQLPNEMSGGERQRVAIARAVVMRPRLLLADEPTGALDTAAGAQVLELLSRLSRQDGITVLLVSYDPAAVEYANRVLRIRDGRVSEDVAAPAAGAPTPAFPPAGDA